MELSKAQRKLISRATALLVGIALCYASVKCFSWGSRARAEERERLLPRTLRERRQSTPGLFAYSIGSGLGAIGVAAAGFAIVPTRVLYSISPK